MKHVLLQIGKHSSIYLLAQIVPNGLSVLMFPIYVHYFAPGEFGAMTLVDLMTAMLIALLASGILSALARHHFEAESSEEQRRVWWTGYLCIAGAMSAACLALALAAEPISKLLFQGALPQGPLWLRLAAASLWMDTQISVVHSYLRAHKRSEAILWQSVGRSLVFVGCVAPGIVVWRLGPTAMFVANVAASLSLICVNYRVIAREWGAPGFSRPVFRELWSYGWPLILIGVLMTLMQQMNRWFLRGHLVEIGLLSLGLALTDKVNRLIVMPFEQIWGTLVYELHKEHPERAVRTFCFVFEFYCYVLISLFFGCSVAVRPALLLVAQPDYLPSVPLIPVLCLAQFCFAMNFQFQVPMRLSKQTYLILPSAVIGVVVAGLSNWRLIPHFGVYGAAWATVATYIAFSAVNLWVARRIDAHPYPFGRIGLMLAGVCATFIGYQALELRLPSTWAALAVGLLLWLIWTLIMAAVSYRDFLTATAEEPADSTVSPGVLDAAL